MLVFVILFVAIASCCDVEEAQPLWGFFQKKWPRNYASAEEGKARFEIFCKNVATAKRLNDIHPDTSYGVTKFMDLTAEEFSRKLMKPFDRETFQAKTNGIQIDVQFGNSTPTEWSWVEKGYVTPIKNQLQCGSCWAFSAVGNIEGQWVHAGNPLTSFSEQQIVDCDTVDQGCNGGLMDNAFKYVVGAGGLETEADYGYEAVQDSCKADKGKFVAHISGFVDLPHDEEKMVEWSYANGPISIALNANDLQFYNSGVFDPLYCNPKSLDHGLLLVGWGTAKSFTGTKDIWTVKNSWGADWGEKGYFRMIRGKNKCGVAEVPCSAQV